ncbi:MAG: Mur ligase family protein [Deltaproteobacteria bacterium]|nr:Mur ligase family protein [Deltaproteobacteria bacterium]
MTVSPPKHVHLLGICGTAMAALAGALKAQGSVVTGTDENVYPPISDQLDRLGIAYNRGYRAENIPPGVELVVVGNVIRRDNPEVQAVMSQGLPYLSMAEAVYRFAIAGRNTLAVVGTHGKTTTTTLAAHALVELGADPGFLTGGIPKNFPDNFRVGGGDWFVIEGDEYDTAFFDKTPKFFKYHPKVVLFTSLEFDHADIYDSLDTIRGHFAKLLTGLPADGLIVACHDDPGARELVAELSAQGALPCPVVTYGLEEGAGCRLTHTQTGPDGVRFTTRWEGREDSWFFPLGGDYNALNAAAVMIALIRLGHAPAQVAAALASFQGVKRRQELRGVAGGVRVLDDFAHHPTAVRLTLKGVRQRYPEGTLWAVFEPRSFTARSSRFQTEWGQAFWGAGQVLLAPPFRPANASANQLLDTRRVAEDTQAGGTPARALGSTDEILAVLEQETTPGDTVLVMSNGGFDNIHQRLLDRLAQRNTQGGTR